MARFPLAVIAAYGPDNAIATKLVVSIVKDGARREPEATRTWATTGGDVRLDRGIEKDVERFIAQHRVKERVSPDRIFGCPHQEGIKRLIQDRDANEWGRSLAVSALGHLAAWTAVPREPIVEYFHWLAREGLEREPTQAWNSLAANCADIEALEVFPLLRQAYDEGLVDPHHMRESELDEVETSPRGEMFRETRERYPPITDVVQATSWWECFASPHVDSPELPPSRPKVGGNQPCPCGSGKKYKKCCGA